MEKIAFCVITFDPIKIQPHSAPQNDRLNFSFVKDIHIDAEIWLEIVVKRQFVSLLFFWTHFMVKYELKMANNDNLTQIEIVTHLLQRICL